MIFKCDFSDVEFLSSSVNAVDNEYDTSAFYGVEKVSMGATNNYDLLNDFIFFKENIVAQHSKLDQRNLIFVKFLNLRHSSITNVNTSYFILLALIDIAFSNIQSIDLFENTCLKKILADKSQQITKEVSVAIEYIYDTSCFVDSEMVSLGTAVESNLGNSSLKFDENTIIDYN